jgi:hypothetical protein
MVGINNNNSNININNILLHIWADQITILLNHLISTDSLLIIITIPYYKQIIDIDHKMITIMTEILEIIDNTKRIILEIVDNFVIEEVVN